MGNFKKNLGITLISLIVTIIIMMILAGVSVNMITKDDGVINEAKEARRQTELADLKERIAIAILHAEAKYDNATMDDVIQQLIEEGIIEEENQVNISTGTITVNKHVIEGMLNRYRVPQ